MVCWLALCLGRKVEERLGKKCQGEVRGKKETEGEEEGKVKEGQSYSIHFRYTHKMVMLVVFGFVHSTQGTN